MFDNLKWRWRYWRFKCRRRSLEAKLFTMGAMGPWGRIKDENDLLGVWRRSDS